MEMEKSRKELTMAAFDRFSDMPDPIVHHIMSFLPTKSATRVSALSKRFNSAWLFRPVFDFDEVLYEREVFPYIYRTSGKELKFLDFVLASLKKHCPSNIYMQRFTLRVWPCELISDNQIQNSIRLAADRNVKELIVKIQGLQKNYCRLPRTTLQNAKSLSVLKLSGFSLELKDWIPCLNLVEDLSLESCSVSANFMLSSAKLTNLNLRYCRGLEKIEIDALNLQSFSYIQYRRQKNPCEINISHFKNLKSLTIEGSAISDDWLQYHVPKFVLLRNLKLVACRNLQKFEIVALNLQSFSYTAYCHKEQHSCEINLSHCKNLKSLTIEKSNITDDWVEHHVSKLVLLRNLKLRACRNLQKIKISNQQLESFELFGCEKLLKAKIEAPNLISFDCLGNAHNSCCPKIILSSTLAHVQVSFVAPRSLTTDSFLNLHDCLSRFGHCKMLSLSFGSDKGLIFPEEMRKYLVHPLLDLRHMRVELWLLSSLTGLDRFVDGLLWLAPNLETMFIYVEVALEFKHLMLNLQFYEWSLRSEDHMIKKVKFVKYEGHDNDKKSLLNFFHEKAITVEANSNH